jgi:metal-dependent amidase/aminoacylase/carboxypeptidase family protein
MQQLVRATVPADQAAVLTFGQLEAGTAANIIPERALLRGSLRALRERDRRALLERLRGYCAAVASGFLASATVSQVGECCPALTNHDGPTAQASQCLQAALGAERVARGAPILASDDMSLFLERVPGSFFRVGAAPPRPDPPAHHSPQFEIDDACLAVGARAGATVLLHTLAP